MDGLKRNGVWDQVKRPDERLVVGTKMIFKRKIGENGKVDGTSVVSLPKGSAKSKDFIMRTRFHLRPQRLTS